MILKKIPEQIRIYPEVVSSLIVASLIGFLSGTASAVFLMALDIITRTRLENPWLLYFLPLAGIAVAFLYSQFGKGSEAGNNLLIDQIHDPKKTVPLRMAPFVLLGTLTTHLFGGSAGREGTAVQMGGTLADQVNKFFRFDSERRKIFLMAGISGGFSSVFGTPLAGAVFGLEVLAIGRIRYHALLPCFISAIIAHLTCLRWGIQHSSFAVSEVPSLNLWSLSWTLIAGICFGVCSYTFSWGSHRLTHFLKKTFNSSLLRAFSGGLLIIVFSALLQSDRYLGLGLPVINASFLGPVPAYDFALKMLFTIVTLSSGFKGGEVTPLFFIGATLGNALTWVLPLPVSLLAGMGFVAVFAGAANTPLACTLMAFELFGSKPGVYMALACVMSYVFSGHTGIYHAQRIEVYKHAQKN
ncbi:MAG: voltage-gated chloride channel family protein [Pseudobdellovibrionaceae bacterium]